MWCAVRRQCGYVIGGGSLGRTLSKLLLYWQSFLIVRLPETPTIYLPEFNSMDWNFIQNVMTELTADDCVIRRTGNGSLLLSRVDDWWTRGAGIPELFVTADGAGRAIEMYRMSVQKMIDTFWFDFCSERIAYDSDFIKVTPQHSVLKCPISTTGKGSVESCSTLTRIDRVIVASAERNKVSGWWNNFWI